MTAQDFSAGYDDCKKRLPEKLKSIAYQQGYKYAAEQRTEYRLLRRYRESKNNLPSLEDAYGALRRAKSRAKYKH
jgi:hypothetical protein